MSDKMIQEDAPVTERAHEHYVVTVHIGRKQSDQFNFCGPKEDAMLLVARRMKRLLFPSQPDHAESQRAVRQRP